MEGTRGGGNYRDGGDKRWRELEMKGTRDGEK